jgi:hypothetical protein
MVAKIACEIVISFRFSRTCNVHKINLLCPTIKSGSLSSNYFRIDNGFTIRVILKQNKPGGEYRSRTDDLLHAMQAL